MTDCVLCDKVSSCTVHISMCPLVALPVNPVQANQSMVRSVDDVYFL